ncbi:MAG: SIS domain-containing protein [candidate division Zixibacteria bacterium]|nr:SIS domain-containing protein [candidate division Zixibacteria bacterium]
MNFLDDIENYFSMLEGAIDATDRESINTVVNLLGKAYEEERQIFIMGNGGSASTASHFACDFNKGLSYGKRKRFKVISLNDNLPILLAYANDVSYENVFVEQLKNFFNPKDYVIGISGSGNSKNVIKAIEYANQNGGITIGFCGYSGGMLKQIAQFCVHVPINDMQISEDLHMIMTHLIMHVLEKQEILVRPSLKIIKRRIKAHPVGT